MLRKLTFPRTLKIKTTKPIKDLSSTRRKPPLWFNSLSHSILYPSKHPSRHQRQFTYRCQVRTISLTVILILCKRRRTYTQWLISARPSSCCWRIPKLIGNINMRGRIIKPTRSIGNYREGQSADGECVYMVCVGPASEESSLYSSTSTVTDSSNGWRMWRRGFSFNSDWDA